jgi:hypothetical protein
MRSLMIRASNRAMRLQCNVAMSVLINSSSVIANAVLATEALLTRQCPLCCDHLLVLYVTTDEQPYDPFAGEHILDSERDSTATATDADNDSDNNSEDSNTNDDVPACTGPVVYVSGEESTGQIAARAQRLELQVRLETEPHHSVQSAVQLLSAIVLRCMRHTQRSRLISSLALSVCV